MLRSWTLHCAAAAAALALACLAPRTALAQTGMTQLKAQDLPVTLVYPTAERNKPVAFGPFTLEVAQDAAPARGNGRLVVLSHGAGGSAFTDHQLARVLAAAGFVVAQPEHRGDNWRDQSLLGPESWKLRPGEVSRTIDAVAADPRFAPLVDAGKVGMHGMSAGGVTGLALAGAQWSLAAMVRHCGAHRAEDPGFCYFGVRDAATREARAAAYARGVPSPGADTLYGERDPRVAAVALTVPAAALFTADSLARVQVPVGILEAPADRVLLPSFHSGYLLAACARCRSIGTVPGAGHYDLLSPLPEALARQLGADPAFDRAALAPAFGRVAAFFQQTLEIAP